MLSRMLLHRPPRGGQISKDKLLARLDKFAAGQWQELLRASVKCAEDAGKLSRRQRQREQVAEEQRAARALKCVQLGEWSAGPQALAGAELAPRTPAKFCATVLADLKMMFQTFLGTSRPLYYWRFCAGSVFCRISPPGLRSELISFPSLSSQSGRLFRCAPLCLDCSFGFWYHHSFRRSASVNEPRHHGHFPHVLFQKGDPNGRNCVL